MKLPLCCSSSVGSEGSSLEQVKLQTEEHQEKESAASAEELGALAPAPPPAVQEVPLYLQKQHVRNWGDGCFKMIQFFCRFYDH